MKSRQQPRQFSLVKGKTAAMIDLCREEYGSAFCENVRRFNHDDFKAPSNFDRIKKGVKTVKDVTKGIQETAKEVKETLDTAKDVIKTPAAALRIVKPLKPTITDLTTEQINKARMVKASHIASEEGFEAAQIYLDEQGIPYDINTQLSSKESLVLLGDDGVKIAYRGTEVTSPKDISADAMIAAGVEQHHPQFKNAEEQLKLVTEQYGAPNELLGYSLGGNKAMTMGNKFGIDTTTFNTFLGKNLIKADTGASHTILRTTEDFASIGVGLARGKEGFKVSSILPHQDKINPVEAHRLENFTETSARRPGATETLLRGVQHAGAKAGELELIDSIKTAQENGQSFTEWVHEFNSRTGQDTTADGSALAGTRMHRNSKWVKYWEEAKSEGSSAPAFTPEENAHFDSIPESEQVYDPAIRPKERASFRNSSASERQAKIADAHEHLAKVAGAVDSHTTMYKASASALKRAIHPTNAATGLAGGIAAHELMDTVIDKDHKIEEHARTGLEGVFAGVTTEMGAAALAGTALSGGALGIAGATGAASYLAGSETTKLVAKGLQNVGMGKDASEGLGAATGGAVGGTVGALGAIGGAALYGTEIGELGGPYGAAAGAAIGTVVGTVGWLVGKFGKEEVDETPDPRAVEADRIREGQERHDVMRLAEEDQARIDSAQNFTRLLAQQNRSEKEQALVEQYQWLASKGHRPLLQQVLDRTTAENNVNT